MEKAISLKKKAKTTPEFQLYKNILTNNQNDKIKGIQYVLARNKLHQINPVSFSYTKRNWYCENSSSPCYISCFSCLLAMLFFCLQCFSYYLSWPVVINTVDCQRKGVPQRPQVNDAEAVEAILAFHLLFQCGHEGHKVSAACGGLWVSGNAKLSLIL